MCAWYSQQTGVTTWLLYGLASLPVSVERIVSSTAREVLREQEHHTGYRGAGWSG